MSFKLLINRKIIDILIGDQNVNDDYKLPYLSGQMLCELSTTFGLQRTYNRGSGACNLSRWEAHKKGKRTQEYRRKVDELLRA